MDDSEKRGPVEKGEKGWPINLLGVVALLIFALIAVFFIARPLLQSKNSSTGQTSSKGGRIIAPGAGQIVKGDTLTVELSVDEAQKVQKVQFWAKTYVDENWQMIGEVNQEPYKIDWKIPENFQNKAIAVTSHIYQKDGKVIKDPGGWREGVIILSQ